MIRVRKHISFSLFLGCLLTSIQAVAMQAAQQELPLTHAAYLDRRNNLERELNAREQVSLGYADITLKTLTCVAGLGTAVASSRLLFSQHSALKNCLLSAGLGLGTSICMYLGGVLTHYFGIRSLLLSASQAPIRYRLHQLERAYYDENAIRARRDQAESNQLLNAIENGREQDVERLLANDQQRQEHAISIQRDDAGRTPFFYAVRAYFAAKAQHDAPRIESAYHVIEQIIRALRARQRNVYDCYTYNPTDTVTSAVERAVQEYDGRLLRLFVANGLRLNNMSAELVRRINADQMLIRLFANPESGCVVCQESLHELDHEQRHLQLLDCAHVICNACQTNARLHGTRPPDRPLCRVCFPQAPQAAGQAAERPGDRVARRANNYQAERVARANNRDNRREVRMDNRGHLVVRPRRILEGLYHIDPALVLPDEIV